MSNLRYFFREAFRGFSRNLSVALGSIVTIFLSLMIIGIFLIGGAMLNNLISSVESEVMITAYISDAATEEQIQGVMAEISNMDYVSSVSFTSKDQALENFSNSMTSNPEIIEQLDGTNPLPASIDVELTDPQQVETVAAAIEANAGYVSICEDSSNPSDSIKYGQDTVERLFSLTNYMRYIGIGLVVLLVFIALVFINNTIRLAILARRREIEIMRLVGASNAFIRGPFLTEGALHAIIGALLAIGVIQILRVFALPQVEDAIRFLDFHVDGLIYLGIYGVLIVAGLIIGLIGSALAMRRYLRV